MTNLQITFQTIQAINQAIPAIALLTVIVGTILAVKLGATKGATNSTQKH